MKKLYVRVEPRTGVQRFFRCGMEFTQAWTKEPIPVDDATAQRLEAEQMLEVSETKPAELENETPNEADPSGDSTTVTGSGTPAAAPNIGSAASRQAAADALDRRDAIRSAVAQLDREDAALWTAGGKAKTEAIAAITGWPVTAAERDAALAEGGAQ